jgi:hypothetical protein
VSDQKTPLRLDAAGSSRDRRTLSDITLPSELETTMQAKHLEASVRWRMLDTLFGFGFWEVDQAVLAIRRATQWPNL